jgi:hypothetical protein
MKSYPTDPGWLLPAQIALCAVVLGGIGWGIASMIKNSADPLPDEIVEKTIRQMDLCDGEAKILYPGDTDAQADYFLKCEDRTIPDNERL